MALETSSEIGIGLGMGVTRVIVHASRRPAPGEQVVEHEGRFVRCRRAFEEATQDGDDDVAVIEIGQDVAATGLRLRASRTRGRTPPIRE